MNTMNAIQVMSSPRQVDIAITGRCNLSCAYCFYADEMVARQDLPTERWLSFFNELGRLGVMDVCLTGGEVFTRPDMFDLIDGVIANRMRYSLLSNGTLITEKVLSQFETGKRHQRLDSIQISIDGSRTDIHDKSRPNSFSRAMRGLQLLMEAQFPVTVRVTINHYNVEDLENIAQILLEEVGLPEFTTNEAYFCGATNRAEGGIVLTSAQRKQAMRTLTDLEARYEGRISATAGPLCMAQEYSRIEKARAAGQSSLPGRGMLSSCGGVFNKIAVLHDGTIVPCHNLSTLHLGTIGVDDLQTVWLEHPLINELRQRREIPLSSLSTCQDCPYLGFCAGGCPGSALFLTGETNARDPLSCFRVYMGEDPSFTLDAIESGMLDNKNPKEISNDAH
jgi:SynChlorMet cassette radical SAM/SPASM protein ScmE